MPATPHVVTYPGKVRIVDAGPKGDDGKRPKVIVKTVPDPRFTHKKTNGRFKHATVTQVLVPAGYRLEHDVQHAKSRSLSGKPDKPTALVKVRADGDGDVTVNHAELEHEHYETTHEGAEKTPHEGMTWTSRKLLAVRAKSTQHAGIVGEGSDAAEAVADMNAKIAAKVKAEGDAKAAERAKLAAEAAKAEGEPYRKGAPEALPELEPAPALPEAGEPEELVTRKG